MLRVVVQLKMKRKRPREEYAQGCGAVKDEEKESQRGRCSGLWCS